MERKLTLKCLFFLKYEIVCLIVILPNQLRSMSRFSYNNCTIVYSCRRRSVVPYSIYPNPSSYFMFHTKLISIKWTYWSVTLNQYFVSDKSYCSLLLNQYFVSVKINKYDNILWVIKHIALCCSTNILWVIQLNDLCCSINILWMIKFVGPCCSINILWVLKSIRMRWEGYVARMGEGWGVYRSLVEKPEGKRPLVRQKRRWEDNIKNEYYMGR
jgi:hypothetical protein